MRRAFETVAIDRLDRIGEWVLLSALCDGRGIARDGRGHGQLTGDKIVWISLGGKHSPRSEEQESVGCVQLCRTLLIWQLLGEHLPCAKRYRWWTMRLAWVPPSGSLRHRGQGEWWGFLVMLSGDQDEKACSRSGRRICKGPEVGKWPGVQRARVAGRSLWRQEGTGTHGLVSCGERHMDSKPGAIATDESRQEETQSDWYSAGGGISGIVERWSPQDFLVTRCRSREMVDLSATYGNKHNGWKSRTRQGGKGSGKTSCVQKVLNTCLYNRHSTICSVQ